MENALAHGLDTMDSVLACRIHSMDRAFPVDSVLAYEIHILDSVLNLIIFLTTCSALAIIYRLSKSENYLGLDNYFDNSGCA